MPQIPCVKVLMVLAVFLIWDQPTAKSDGILHDAEYYVLEVQNGEKWKAEDEQLQTRLSELREKHGSPPNIVHIMWDDTAYGDVGIPATLS